MVKRRDERRKHPRLPLGVPVEIHTGGADRKERQILAQTVTSNISAGGLYVRLSGKSDIKLKTPVDLRITLPYDVASHFPNLTFHLVGEGTVVRVDRSANGADEVRGIAIQFRAPLRFENFLVV